MRGKIRKKLFWKLHENLMWHEVPSWEWLCSAVCAVGKCMNRSRKFISVCLSWQQNHQQISKGEKGIAEYFTGNSGLFRLVLKSVNEKMFYWNASQKLFNSLSDEGLFTRLFEIASRRSTNETKKRIWHIFPLHILHTLRAFASFQELRAFLHTSVMVLHHLHWMRRGNYEGYVRLEH